MKVKYMYQQMLSHLGIITVAFLILSLLVSQYVESLVYKNKEEELISYGEQILKDLNNNFLTDTFTLNDYQDVLKKRNIYLTMFDSNGQIVYPIDNRNLQIQFTEKEWEQISQGKRVVVNVDFNRFEQAVSLVILPYKKGDYLLGGILLTAPVSGTREMIQEFNSYLIITVCIALGISFIISWFLSKIHVRRIKQLQKATSAVARGDYNVTVRDSDFDEIGELASDFNKMVGKLRKSMDEIESLENRRRQFMADVSHEMRTPLTTISGIIEGLRNNMTPESEKEKGLALVSQETKRLIRLVNENLDYEKIRSNQVKLNKEEIELIDVFEIIKDQLAIQAEERNDEIVVDVENDTMVYADYDRLVQILLNITKNSIQFTENGLITLRGREAADSTVIEIEDTGIGIDPKDVENIWHRFYKADISRKSNPFGEFGLGLSIVKQLVLLHDGKIDVKSEKGKGTKFTIWLPVKPNKPLLKAEE